MILGATERVVPPMPLPELLGSDDALLAGTLVSGLQIDSRSVSPGDLFLALPGDQFDGRHFIEQAVANGAVAVAAEAPVTGFVDELPVPLVEIPELRFEVGAIAAKFYRYPSRHMHVIGITGTNGKTTVSQMIAQLLRILGQDCGVIGTLGASLDEQVSATQNTTPDPISLQHLLAQWQQQGVATVSMEVSSHALVQGRVNGIEFDTAVFTNLSQDHLDYHLSMSAYASAKMRLFSHPKLQHAVVNADDDIAALVAASASKDAKVVAYTVRGNIADLSIADLQFHTSGVAGELTSVWGKGKFESPLAGSFNVENLAAAITALALKGEDLASLLAAVAKLRAVPGRMQSVPSTSGVQVIIDYAHTPDALEKVLGALRPQVKGDLITVFGCGGDRDTTKRQLMGRVACTLSDHVVVTSDNPRSEEPSLILRDIASGCFGRYHLLEDRAEAISSAIAEALPGDCVVIAGKGHEDYQLVKGERFHFSDEAHALDALAVRALS